MSDCVSYCEHGGCCELEEGHEGLHDSRYCQWSDEEDLPKEMADALFTATAEDMGMDKRIVEFIKDMT